MGSFGRLWQFYSRQVLMGGSSVFVAILLTQFVPGVVERIPQTGLEALSGVFATLLGLTFTAFSILTTFMPAIRRDFVKSRTFESMGKTFVMTMGAQMAALGLAAGSFIDYTPGALRLTGPLLILAAILSIALMGQLMAYMFSLFRMARSEL